VPLFVLEYSDKWMNVVLAFYVRYCTVVLDLYARLVFVVGKS